MGVLAGKISKRVMSAVTFHLDAGFLDVAPAFKHYVAMAGLGSPPNAPMWRGLLRNEQMMEQIRMAAMRYNLKVALSTRNVSLEKKKDGTYAFVIDPPISGDELPTFRIGGQLQSLSLLSTVQKMRAPSFSLPAGSPAVNGSCPGSSFGMTAEAILRSKAPFPTPEDVEKKQQELQARGLQEIAKLVREYNEPAKRRLALVAEQELQRGNINIGSPEHVMYYASGQAICEYCYATGGNYLQAVNQVASVVRHVWAEWAIMQPPMTPWGKSLPEIKIGRHGAVLKPSHFSEVMIDAIESWPYYFEKTEHEFYRSFGYRFFRFHDSGDFFSIPYFRACVYVAALFTKSPGLQEGQKNEFGLTPTIFWAPTRMWIAPNFRAEVRRLLGGARLDSFVLRPSAYSANAIGPDLYLDPESGWDAPTVVFFQQKKEAYSKEEQTLFWDIDCGVYKIPESEKRESNDNSDLKPPKHCQDAVTPEIIKEMAGGRVKGCRACWLLRDHRINYTAH